MENNEIKFTHVIYDYLKQYIKPIILFIIFILIFTLIFSLYNLELEAILYSSLICCFIGLICICINFINYYKRNIYISRKFTIT